MAQPELQSANTQKTKRKVHHNLRIDMTPMVDLGFLLISFFIFTTTLSETTMDLIVPADGDGNILLPQSKTLTLILAQEDKVYAYEGIWETAIHNKNIRLTNYSPDGIRNMILSKKKQLQNPDELIVLIKPLETSIYKNTIDALDEMLINGINTYTIVEASDGEKSYVTSRKP